MTALMTDRYEFSMLSSFIADGIHEKKAYFEVFTRKLQPGFRYGVFAGLGRLLPMIRDFTFPAEDVEWMLDNGIIDRPTAEYLMTFRFEGDIFSYREGDLYFPYSPVMTVSGTLGECILLETLVLSVINHDSAIASRAARMVSAAKGRPIIEMGSRRTNEESAIAAARAAYIAGFASTSNLAAGRRFGVPTAGTAAHAFTLAHGDEMSAFRSQVKTHGAGTSLLVDTYDIEQGIEHAVMAAREAGAKGPGGVRIDSGDLAAEAEKARAQLDSMGAPDTRVIVTSDLDEHVIKDLSLAPIDGYGVGTKLVSTPPGGFVYKLVAIEETDNGGNTWMRPVAKKSKDKASVGGKKWAYRVLKNGKMTHERYSMTKPLDGDNRRFLQYKSMTNGIVNTFSLEYAKAFHQQAIAELPDSERAVWSGTDFGPFLTAEKD